MSVRAFVHFINAMCTVFGVAALLAWQQDSMAAALLCLGGSAFCSWVGAELTDL